MLFIGRVMPCSHRRECLRAHSRCFPPWVTPLPFPSPLPLSPSPSPFPCRPKFPTSRPAGCCFPQAPHHRRIGSTTRGGSGETHRGSGREGAKGARATRREVSTGSMRSLPNPPGESGRWCWRLGKAPYAPPRVPPGRRVVAWCCCFSGGRWWLGSEGDPFGHGLALGGELAPFAMRGFSGVMEVCQRHEVADA